MSKILGRYLMPHPPIIIPEIGQGEEKKVQDTVDSMREIASEIKTLRPNTIVVITPHGPLFEGAIAISNVDTIYGDFVKFGNQDIKLKKKINTSLTKKIIENILEEDISIAPIDKSSKSKYNIEVELDHGALVPLYHINHEYNDYDLVHITYGMLEKSELYKVGMIIKNTIEELDESAVIIASGDLSHRLKETGPYDYNENGEIFDQNILSLLENGHTKNIFNMDKDLIEQAGECGLRSIYILLGSLDECDFKGELLSYEGTFGVGYGVMKIKEKGSKSSLLDDIKTIETDRETPNNKSDDSYVMLAYESLRYFLEHEEYMEVQATFQVKC